MVFALVIFLIYIGIFVLVNSKIQLLFYKTNPLQNIITSSMTCYILCIGLINFKIQFYFVKQIKTNKLQIYI